MCIADPVNGIFCICQTPLGDVLTLWNPAMRQSMVVELSKFKGPDMQFLVSVGLAFDFRNNDFLVLRIFSILKITGDALSQVEFELHPMKSPSGYWKKKTCEEYFYIDKPTCDVIVKGEPYWLAYFTSFFVAGKYEALVHFNVVELELEWWPLPFVEAVENNLFPVNFQDSVGEPYWLAYLTDNPKSGQHEGVIRFNLGNMGLEWLPLPFIGAGYYIKYLVKVEYCLGMLTWEGKEKCYIDVWMMSHQEHDWSKKYKVGPFFGIDGFMGCLRNGDIAKYNPVTYSAKYGVKLPDAKKESHVIFDCPESLFLINGMEPVKPQKGLECGRLLRVEAVVFPFI
ncbi:hypothetical protein T459_05165 [Capsicum annuum]|uniref:F-box associated beta-propeller type 1 domain-containing protein n=1 Tax=Capsicum annuum TaxID=4072 RepID=A0A2G3A740_CAPAN|nr:hypothetical protein T459_05165 [Capsicum annuum]